MESLWNKAKAAMGISTSDLVPKVQGESCNSRSEMGSESETSAADFTAPRASSSLNHSLLIPNVTTSIASEFMASQSGSRSGKKTCAICLGEMKEGHGALFTSECSHSFHFSCIASNVKHGNLICPICRSQWKEIPFISPVDPNFQDPLTQNLHPPPPRTGLRSYLISNINFTEPDRYDDDEPVESPIIPSNHSENRSTRKVEIKTYPELSAVPKTSSKESFSILIHLKAPCAENNQNGTLAESQLSRAPIDLVTVLDISGSMSGTKLALLKVAMNFVIQNLSSSDRLSVVVFSSTARRLFPLRRMTSPGRQHALQAISTLVSGGGTNIAEGLRKGAKVIEERKERNPVCSIILLSDGQDTFTIPPGTAEFTSPDYQSLLPPSLRSDAPHRVPVHAFGFGADHDSALMHSISENSGGTFSFIESDGMIQDAFAQCIGGLLSVVAQELVVLIESAHPGVLLASIRSGNYVSRITNQKKGSISVGDLYADEERGFLLSVNVPPATEEETVLLSVCCSYKDPLSKEAVNLDSVYVKIQRPEDVTESSVSVEVERERIRVSAAEAMAEARSAAERGSFSEAVSLLQARRSMLSNSSIGQSGDQFCCTLDDELREMQGRMESRQSYEESGRAYMLSGLSSHSWQRATTRGASADNRFHSYQTPLMADMLQRSQALLISPRQPPPAIGPATSLPPRSDSG